MNTMNNTLREEQINKWKERPFSWSQLSSFEYDKEQWYDKYILGKPSRVSAEMTFGSEVGKRLETDPTYLPMIPRHNVMEHEFKCFFGKIPLIGYADSFCTITDKKLNEHKTGVKKWDQKRVDEHGQLDMYLLMHWIMRKIRPEDVEVNLIWLPTKRSESGDFNVTISFVEPIEENIKTFTTKRTMKDIMNFGMRINKVYKEMEQYALKHE